MGYYQWVTNVDVCLRNHEVFHSKEDVLTQIKENNQEIEKKKKELFGLCCGSPKELLNTKDTEGYEGNPIDVLSERFNDIFEDDYCGLEYLIAHNVDLQYVADNWDKMQQG